MIQRLYRRGLFLLAISILALVPRDLAQTRELSGNVFAYDPVLHSDKRFLGDNTEIVILKLNQSNNDTYLKLVFKSLGQDQLDKKFFEGDAVLVVRAVRDQTYDLNWPEFLDGSALFSYLNGPVQWQPRKLLLTDHFNTTTPPTVALLKCYVVKDGKNSDQHLLLHPYGTNSAQHWPWRP
jgi:hypothetical protein